MVVVLRQNWFSCIKYHKYGIFREATCQNQKIRAEFFSSTVWGSSSAGRALRSQCRGREFDPPLLHHDRIPSASSRRSDACFHRRFSYLQVLNRLHETRLRASLLLSTRRLQTDSREQNPRPPVLRFRFLLSLPAFLSFHAPVYIASAWPDFRFFESSGSGQIKRKGGKS